jgi:hypothetical protein
MNAGFTIEPLTAQRSITALMLAEAPQFAFPPFAAFPLLQVSVLEVVFPFGVKRIGFSLDFYVPCYGHETGLEQADRISLIVHAREHPVIASYCFEVVLFHPVGSFSGMSSFCPMPNLFEDGRVHSLKHLLRHRVSVIIRPSPDEGVLRSVSHYTGFQSIQAQIRQSAEAIPPWGVPFSVDERRFPPYIPLSAISSMSFYASEYAAASRHG